MRHLFIILSLMACQTPVQDPGRARVERKNIIGFATGAEKSDSSANLFYSRNVSQNFAWRSSFDYVWKPNQLNIDLSSGRELIGESPSQETSRNIRERNTSLHFGFNYFPWRSQFIFAGAKATVGQYQTSFLERSRDFSISERHQNIEFLDNYFQVALPMGLSVDFVKSSLNFYSSVNPAWQIGKSRKFLGYSQQNVDSELLSNSLEAIEKNRRFKVYFESGFGKTF